MISVLDFYDIVQVDDAHLDKIVKQSSDNIQNVYKTIKGTIIPKLEKLGWSADIVPLPMSSEGIYWTDYPNDYLKEKHGAEWLDKPTMYFIVYIDEEGKNINLNRDIAIAFEHMDKDMKTNIIDIFQTALPDNYEWSGDNNDLMTMYYSPKSIEKIDTSKLKSEDVFPQLTFSLDVKQDLFDIDIDDFDVIKNIKKHIKKFKYSMEYGQHDITFDIFGIDENKVFKLYSGIMDAINNKNSGVTSYHMYYYLNDNMYYELKKMKLFKKDKNSLTLEDFIKKYSK